MNNGSILHPFRSRVQILGYTSLWAEIASAFPEGVDVIVQWDLVDCLPLVYSTDHIQMLVSESSERNHLNVQAYLFPSRWVNRLLYRLVQMPHRIECEFDATRMVGWLGHRMPVRSLASVKKRLLNHVVFSDFLASMLIPPLLVPSLFRFIMSTTHGTKNRSCPYRKRGQLLSRSAKCSWVLPNQAKCREKAKVSESILVQEQYHSSKSSAALGTKLATTELENVYDI